MSRKLIEKLRADRDEARSAADTILAKMESGTDLSDNEKSNLEALVKDATDLDGRISELTTIEMQRIEADALARKFDRVQSELGAPEENNEPKSFGSAFTSSREFQAYTGTGTSPIHTTDLTLIQSRDVGGNQVAPKSRGRDAQPPRRITPLIDALYKEPVNSNAIEWIEWPHTVPSAGVVLEGVDKPEATYLPVVRADSLDKIAHHVPFTREALEDIPRMQAIVEGALMDGVAQKAEANAGLVLTNNLGTLPSAESDTLLKALRVGIANVQDAGYAPTGVVLNPIDYAELDIESMLNTVNGASRNAPVWGLNAIPSSAVPAGTAFVGDWGVAMTHFYRSQVQVYMTDSHNGEFVTNVLRVLAEQRSKTCLVRPEAIVACSVTAP